MLLIQKLQVPVDLGSYSRTCASADPVITVRVSGE